MATDVCVHQAAVKPLGLQGRIQRQRVLAYARCAKVIALTADRDDQRIVMKAPRLRDPLSLVVDMGSKMNGACPPIEPDQFADAIAEMMPMRLRQVVDLVHAEIHAAGSDLMQQRLPQMGAAFVHEGHVGPFVTTQLVAEPSHERQPASAAADDDDAMEIGRIAHHVFRSELAGVGQGHSAAIRGSARALVGAASTTANAVMLRMPRTVAVCVRI